MVRPKLSEQTESVRSVVIALMAFAAFLFLGFALEAVSGDMSWQAHLALALILLCVVVVLTRQ